MHSSRQLTLIEKLGFRDPDRTTKNHDIIQLWALKNIRQVLISSKAVPDTIVIKNVRLESPVTTSSRETYIVGFLDILVTGTYRCSRTDEEAPLHVAIEVKSHITSCGDVIRQINFYKKYLPFDTIPIVISSDNRFEAVLVSQGISFVKYGSPTLFEQTS